MILIARRRTADAMSMVTAVVKLMAEALLALRSSNAEEE